MKKLLLLLIFTNSLIYSQESREIKIGEFHTLKVLTGLKVDLIKSDDAKIIINGYEADRVSVKNKDGILKISFKILEGFNVEDVDIQLFYTDDINVLDANEGGQITSNKTLEQQHIELKTQEGARIEMPVKVKYLTIKSVSGGVIDISGTTQNQTIEANTGGIYYGFNMESLQTTASAASGAIVEVFVSEMLDAKVNFGGSIYYKGDPEELKTKKVIRGKIEKE